MSNRLKRKLDNYAAEGTGMQGNLLESFVQYGTALPSLDKKDKQEFVPVWQQTVTDDQGRRRLHGAFTGGFSAGYYNSVGSKEGWTPSNFISSRSQRAKVAQSAQDFMDEEDLADAQEQSLKKLSAGDSSTSASEPQPEAGEDRLLSTIRTSQDRTGVALLRKMGWKEGQGCGPRLSAQARQRQARELGLAAEDWSEQVKIGQTFAPLDRPVVGYKPRQDARGLGYDAGPSLRAEGSGGARAKGKMPLGGAFGISALEDGDEDNINLFDGAGHAPPQPKMGKHAQEVGFRDPESRGKTVQRKAQVATSDSKFLDGTPVLPGFNLTQLPPPSDTWFPPPAVPPNFQPRPKAVMALQLQSNGAAGPTGQPPPQLDERGKVIMTADQRSAILSDEPPKQRSVFDFISKKNQERITTAIAAGQRPADLPTAPSQPTLVELTVPELDKNIAQSALKGFMPYGDNISKQARYRFFLQAAAGLKSDEGDFKPKVMSDQIEDMNKELQDFKKSALVFKPMSRAMAGRFTSGNSASTAKDLAMPHAAGLQFISSSKAPEASTSADGDAPAQSTESDDPAVNAVRMGQFGALTRKTVDFYPCKLLCKRFGVRQPNPGGQPGEGGEDEEGAGPKQDEKELLNNATMEELRKQGGYAPAVQPVSTTSSALAPAAAARNMASIGLGEDETQGQDILTYERPNMDLFKAIFAESEDEEDETDAAALRPPQTSEIIDLVQAKPSASTKANLEPVSFTDFKPTFIPRVEGANGDGKAEKKRKKKKTKAATLSFEVDDGDEASTAPQLVKEKRKKSSGKDEVRKKAKVEAAPVEEEDEWVEKPSAVPAPKLSRGRALAADLF